MQDILITHIKGLVQTYLQPPTFVAGTAMGSLPVVADAYLHISNGLISSFGKMSELPFADSAEVINASDRFVFPSFIDSHTHLVFAASREEEFVMKIKGMTYSEIAAKGGGILNSARKLQHASEDELYESAKERANEIIGLGTGAVEIKSGYGLTVKDELKMLRVARRVGKDTPLTVKTTFLGAHAVPPGWKKESYIQLIRQEMIPAVAAENLAEYIDVFCEEGFFSREETIQIIEEGKRYGMKPRIHANQLNKSGGVQAGIATSALSVDHLENIGEEEISLLKNSSIMPTALPGAAFFLNLPFPPARKMIDDGLPLAIASDFNPGSAPSGNMQLMLSLACIKMKMTPEEVINASTINTAHALELSEMLGTITPGKIANVFITKPIPSYSYLPYHFGNNMVEKIILNGKIV